MEKQNSKLRGIDKASYNYLQQKLQEEEQEKRIIDRNRSQVHKRGTDEAWDGTEFRALEEHIEVLESTRSIYQQLLQNVTIVSQINHKSQINFEDIARIKLYFSETDFEEVTVKLVGITKHDLNPDYEETSVISPVGSAIYGRSVGDNISCQIGNAICRIEILEKINRNQEKRLSRKKSIHKNN